MEGVGARLGRSSTRYGPATVFTGPVRKWKKKWVHVTRSSNANNSHHGKNNNADGHGIGGSNSLNGTAATVNNGSHLLLYKWTPITQSGNGNGSLNGNGHSDGGGEKGSLKEDDEPPRRKFKYIPIALLEEEQKEEEEAVGVENVDEEAKLGNTDPVSTLPNPKSDVSDEKPDINDVPMEENEDDKQGVRQDLNETLDLSL